jgi:hypothetical protein
MSYRVENLKTATFGLETWLERESKYKERLNEQTLFLYQEHRLIEKDE